MNVMENGLITGIEHKKEGLFRAVITDSWMIQFLNYMPRLSPDMIVTMQKHVLSDESFILLNGKAILYIAEGENFPNQIEGIVLYPEKLYNVPKGMWHSLILSEDAKLLIVENADTTPENSPKVELSGEQKKYIKTHPASGRVVSRTPFSVILGSPWILSGPLTSVPLLYKQSNKHCI